MLTLLPALNRPISSGEGSPMKLFSVRSSTLARCTSMVRSACNDIMLTISRSRRRLTFTRPVAWSGSGIAVRNTAS